MSDNDGAPPASPAPDVAVTDSSPDGASARVAPDPDGGDNVQGVVVVASDGGDGSDGSDSSDEDDEPSPPRVLRRSTRNRKPAQNIYDDKYWGKHARQVIVKSMEEDLKKEDGEDTDGADDSDVCSARSEDTDASSDDEAFVRGDGGDGDDDDDGDDGDNGGGESDSDSDGDWDDDDSSSDSSAHELGSVVVSDDEATTSDSEDSSGDDGEDGDDGDGKSKKDKSLTARKARKRQRAAEWRERHIKDLEDDIRNLRSKIIKLRDDGDPIPQSMVDHLKMKMEERQLVQSNHRRQSKHSSKQSKKEGGGSDGPAATAALA